MTAACKPATTNGDASPWTHAPDDDPIALFDDLIGLKPLDTGSKRKHCVTCDSISGKWNFQKKTGNKPLSYATESVASVGENELWKVMSFMW